MLRGLQWWITYIYIYIRYLHQPNWAVGIGRGEDWLVAPSGPGDGVLPHFAAGSLFEAPALLCAWDARKTMIIDEGGHLRQEMNTSWHHFTSLTCRPFFWFSKNFSNRHVGDVFPLFAATPAFARKRALIAWEGWFKTIGVNRFQITNLFSKH